MVRNSKISNQFFNPLFFYYALNQIPEKNGTFFLPNKINNKNGSPILKYKRGEPPWDSPLFSQLREPDSNWRPLGYEPNELPLLHPAIFMCKDTTYFLISKAKHVFYLKKLHPSNNQSLLFLNKRLTSLRYTSLFVYRQNPNNTKA